jgi:hypothetical protein
MTRQWIFYDHADKEVFERVDFRPTPTSSRIPAEELDGMTASRAGDYLADRYEHVKVKADGGRIGKGIIFCDRERTT